MVNEPGLETLKTARINRDTSSQRLLNSLAEELTTEAVRLKLQVCTVKEFTDRALEILADIGILDEYGAVQYCLYLPNWEKQRMERAAQEQDALMHQSITTPEPPLEPGVDKKEEHLQQSAGEAA